MHLVNSLLNVSSLSPSCSGTFKQQKAPVSLPVELMPPVPIQFKKQCHLLEQQLGSGSVYTNVRYQPGKNPGEYL